MADPFISLLVAKIDTLLSSQINLIRNAKDDLEKLKSEVEAIRSAINSADASPYFTFEGVQDWINKLRNAAYDAEDMIDGYQMNLHRNRSRVLSKTNKVRRDLIRFQTWFKENLSLPHQLGTKIKAINEELSQISKERQNYKLDEYVSIGQSSSKNITSCISGQGGSRGETTPNLVEKHIVGRENDKEKLKGYLLSENPSSPVICIVGIGGIGKTTLARMVFNDDEVKKCFEGSLWWVCASERPKSSELARKILEAISMDTVPTLQLSVLTEKLVKMLSERKFLLVLDDVWEIDWWRELETPLTKGASGSRILITTRKEEVSCGIKTSYTHKPNSLSFRQSWELFLANALNDGERSHALEGVHDVAEGIVRKCGGLPLVIQVVGKVMSFRARTRMTWESILNSKIWDWKSPDLSSNGILPGLLLSYDDLTPPLKRCFTYCCMFPKGYSIFKEEMVEHWTSQGFIALKGDEDIEVVAEEYFNELVGRCLIEGKASSEAFGMHDIIHDLALYVGKREYNIDNLNDYAHHLSLTKLQNFSGDYNKLKAAKVLRTLLCPFDYLQVVPLDNIFHTSKRLRVLDLHGSEIGVLPESIGELVLLKYLNLSKTNIKQLPSSIGKLISLQTLRLNDSKIESLPNEIGCLTSLRHLHVHHAYKLQFMDRGLGKLDGLHTLSCFIIFNDSAERDDACNIGELGDLNKLCNIGELGNLNKLRGTLVIKHMERVMNKSDMQEAQFHQKKYLVNLELEYSHQWMINKKRVENVLSELQLPPHLASLRVDNYVGSSLSSELFLQCNSLTTLTLAHCEFLETLPAFPVALTNLTLSYCTALLSLPPAAPSLKSLNMRHCSRLMRIPCFPLLETMIFEFLGVWEGWLSGEGSISFLHLRELKVQECPMFEALPTQFSPAIENLCVEGCAKVKVLWEGDGVYLPRLKCLTITESQELTYLTLGDANLPKLEKLVIKGCSKLTSLPAGLLRFSPQLFEFEIFNMRQLDSLGLPQLDSRGQGAIELPKLERLCIYQCPLLASEQLDDLLGNRISVKKLSLTGLSNLRSLPKQSFLLLQELKLMRCPNITKLRDVLQQDPPHLTLMVLSRLENLSCLKREGVSLAKLERLRINHCPKLTSEELNEMLIGLNQLKILNLGWLPQLRSLPEQLANLLSLEQLGIDNCPNITLIPDGLATRLGIGLKIHG